MKIAVWHNLVSGGGKRALTYHIKALKQKGHSIEVWTPDTSLIDTLHAFKVDVRQHVLPLKDQLQGIRQPSYSFQQYQYVNKRNEIIKKHCKACAEEIKSKGFEILFANSCSINYMSFMSLYSHVPSAIYLGEPYRWNYEAAPKQIWAAPSNKFSFAFLKEHLRLAANRIQVLEEVNAAKGYNKILVNSLYSRESVMRAYGLNSEVCYLGIDDSFFISEQVTKKPYVVCVGFMYYLKGADRVVKAISKVPLASRPKLLWICNGVFQDYKKEIEILANNLNVEIEILVNVEEEKMKSIVSEAAAMIYMPRLEPFGFTPLEANALGTMVIGIAEAGVRETISHGKNGLLISTEDFNSAADYIERAINDLEYSKSFGQQAKEYARENWNFKKLSDNIEASLQNVIEVHG
jgi:glycosyltransferase involved in cell wall biosynthesis